MKKIISKISVALISVCFLALLPYVYGSETPLESAKKITGKYTGEWTFYGISEGKVVEKGSWTDVLTAGNAKEDGKRAYVEAEDVMFFSDGTTRTSNFIEGYFYGPDGTAGDRFYEIDGKVISFKKLTANDWSYQTAPDLGELWFMGFDPALVVFSSHVASKTTTYDGDIETDHVTRLTTVQWKDVNGLRSIQFVSLKGEHRRSP